MAIQTNDSNTEVVALAKPEEEVSILTQKEMYQQEIAKTGEIDKLTAEIDLFNPQTIVEFGAPTANEISKCADVVLKEYNLDTITKSSDMMNILGKIMDKFDSKELDDVEKKGFLGKTVRNVAKKLDAIVHKYTTMGTEIEKICVELRTFEADINKSNTHLENMYDSNLVYYRQLVAYIMAGEQGIREIEDYIGQLQQQSDGSDMTKQFDIQSAEQAKLLLEQRLDDLRKAEVIAIQSVPMLKSLQYGNLNLTRKINSAFIVTLPIFKNAIAQAVIAKQQKLQTQALSALDERTNEMLLKNATNVAEQMKMTTRLAGSSAVKIETIEQSYKTIMDGIKETQAIQAELSQKRENDKLRLAQIENDYLSMKGQVNLLDSRQ